MPQIRGKGRCRRNPLKVLRQDLAAAAPALAMFQGAKPGLEHVVGPGDQADASTDQARKANGVTPKETAVFLQMLQDDVDRSALILG